MIVIYNFNDSGLCYKTKILANLALAKNVNYICNLRCKQKRTYDYDRKKIIVQAADRIKRETFLEKFVDAQIRESPLN